MREHPKTGTGHPEPLKGKPEGRWSRQITKLAFRVSKGTIWNAYRFMGKEI